MPPAGADQYESGSSCQYSELGKTQKSGSGAQLRCLPKNGGYAWTSDSGTESVIKHLESAGYTVNVERFGHKSRDQCAVTGVLNPHTVTRTDRTGPGSHVSTHVVSKTITVTLNCN